MHSHVGWKAYWQARFARVFDLRPPNGERWVIVDVESSGLNPNKDRLLSIAACAVRFDVQGKPVVAMSDSFEVVIRQPENPQQAVDKNNILIHGIGLGAQRTGVHAQEALLAFLEYVGNSPLLAFHSWFDEILINRALKKELGRLTHKHWLDLEHLAAVLHQENHQLPLDIWMQRYDITCQARHQAAADVLATAQLFLKLWPLLVRRKARDWKSLKRIAAALVTLPGRRGY
ncbi:MAG: 3'-5' exonuclease [Limnobacter sp.]|nr:3'-5' exonuclease [Limnobacter sp.]